MGITNRRIILGIGIIVVALATWFAFRKPSAPPLRLPQGSGGPTATSAAGVATGGNSMPANPAESAHGAIGFLAPTATSTLAIGTQYTVTWNRPAEVAGQLVLINATSGAVVGWVQQSLGPQQVIFPWDVRSVFLGASNPAAKDILPGRYYLKLIFDSPQVPAVKSQSFLIAPPTPASPLESY